MVKEKAFLLFGLSLIGASALANVKVVATLPDLAWAARQIGKDKVEVVSLLKGVEDPHYVDAVPSFVQNVANADVVCLVGMDLEVGWLPKVLARSGNAKVQPGGAGYCETGKLVGVLEKPEGAVDRSMGDVHPQGNPHFWPSPIALGEGARAIRDTLARVDSANADFYQKNYDALIAQLHAMVAKNRARITAAFGKREPVFAQYHREFSYFFAAYGLKSSGTVEEKPGIPPSAGRIAQVGAEFKAHPVQLLLGADHSPKKTLEKVAELSGVKVQIVSISVRAEGEASDYETVQSRLVDAIVQSAGNNK